MGEIKASLVYLRGLCPNPRKIIRFFLYIFSKAFGEKNNSSTFAVRFE
jgi:hypothetical protein